jgi:hypothetical protein
MGRSGCGLDRQGGVRMGKPLKYLVVALGIVLTFWPAGAKSQNTRSRKKSDNTKLTNPATGAVNLMGTNGSGGPAPDHDLNGTWIGGGESNLMTYVPPLTPAGEAKFKLNIPDPFSIASNDPWKTCDTFGMPRIVNNEVRTIGFATMPDRVIILENYNKVWREVWMDGRQLPKDVGHRDSKYSSRWYGYSVGHWDGPDTLVVETVGMMPESWVNRLGYPHSLDAQVIERYTRVDHNHLKMTETLIDPAYYTKPYLIATDTYKWIAGEDKPEVAKIPFADEQVCIASQAIQYMNSVEIPSKGDKPIK